MTAQSIHSKFRTEAVWTKSSYARVCPNCFRSQFWIHSLCWRIGGSERMLRKQVWFKQNIKIQIKTIDDKTITCFIAPFFFLFLFTFRFQLTKNFRFGEYLIENWRFLIQFQPIWDANCPKFVSRNQRMDVFGFRRIESSPHQILFGIRASIKKCLGFFLVWWPPSMTNRFQPGWEHVRKASSHWVLNIICKFGQTRFHNSFKRFTTNCTWNIAIYFVLCSLWQLGILWPIFWSVDCILSSLMGERLSPPLFRLINMAYRIGRMAIIVPPNIHTYS